MRLSRMLLALLLPSLALAADAGKITLGDKGITVAGGTMGSFTLEFPKLADKDQKPVHKLQEKRVAEKAATLTYEGGGTCVVTVGEKGEVAFAFSNLPEDVKSFGAMMILPGNLNAGGTYAFDKAEATAFPAEKPAKPHLFQNHARQMVVRNVEGKTLTIKTPEFTYHQLTDNREWKWNVYAWKYSTPYNPDHKGETFTFQIGDGGQAGAPAKRVVLVDALGQNTRVDFPEKIKSVEDLKKDAEAEKAYYNGLNPPAVDSFGGQPGSGEKLGLSKTGFFHVEQKGPKWFLVDPDGNLFFAIGVCTYQPVDDYTYIAGRESIYEWLPSPDGEFASAFRPQDAHGTVLSFHLANMIRKYGKPYDADEYRRTMITRLRKWGFNCGGPFTGANAVNTEMSFPYVTSLPFGPFPGMPDIPGVTRTWDPFDEKNIERVKANFAKSLPGRKDDPLLIGYYLSNEPLYEDLPKVLPRLDGTKFACKRKLVEFLQVRYGEIAKFDEAWKTQAKSFEDLVASGIPVTSNQASDDIADFCDVFFEAYYKLVHDTFKQHDPNHMLLANRFQSGTINNQRLMKTAGKYMDVIAFNYYTYGVDLDFLKRIHEWSGRPLLLSEWFYDSPKESGLRPFRDVSTQVERGLAYRNYVEQSASTGFVLGSTWFTLVDQAPTGRWFEKYNGESANSGLIAVTDRPWKDMLAGAMQTNYTIYDLLTGQRAAYKWEDPRVMFVGAQKQLIQIPRAAGEVKLDGTAAGFPGTPAEPISGKRLVTGSDAAGLEGSFKVCWDDNNLYLIANIVDATPMQNSRKGSGIWQGDGVELFIGFDKLDQTGAPLFSDRHILLSAGQVDGQPQFHVIDQQQQPAIRLAVYPDANKGYSLQAAIPLSALGFAPGKNQEIRFDLAVDDSADGNTRQRQLMWNGTAKNSGDRGGWGRAVFASH